MGNQLIPSAQERLDQRGQVFPEIAFLGVGLRRKLAEIAHTVIHPQLHCCERCDIMWITCASDQYQIASARLGRDCVPASII